MKTKTLMGHIWQEFWIGIPLNVFREMRNTDTTWGQLEDMLEDFENLRNKYIGCNLGNSENYLVHKNNKFPFGVYGNWFNVWDDDSKNLGDFKLDDDYKNQIPTEDFCNWVETILKNRCDGIVHCSDCKKEMKVEYIAGRYFAGIYCKDCWEGKWKAIEAKEDYN